MADPRGFRYALQPLALKAEWEADEALAELAQASGALAEAERTLAALSAQLAQAHAFQRTLAGASLNVAARQQAFRYLAALDERVQSARARRDEASLLRERGLERMAQRRNFADGLGRHRKDCAGDYQRLAAEAAFRDADDTWLQRLIWGGDQ